MNGTCDCVDLTSLLIFVEQYDGLGWKENNGSGKDGKFKNEIFGNKCDERNNMKADIKYCKCESSRDNFVWAFPVSIFFEFLLCREFVSAVVDDEKLSKCRLLLIFDIKLISVVFARQTALPISPAPTDK